MISLVMLIVAIVLFLLEVFSVVLGSVKLVPLGLAFMAASFLPWGTFVVNRNNG